MLGEHRRAMAMCKKIYNQYSSIKAQLQNIEKLLCKNSPIVPEVWQEPKQEFSNDEQQEINLKFPLESVEDVQQLEEVLSKSDTYKEQFYNHFKIVGGTDGQQNGEKIARQLINMLFTRNVLTCFSWTGTVLFNIRKLFFYNY